EAPAPRTGRPVLLWGGRGTGGMTESSRGVSSVGRARRSQRRGRGFESLTLHHLIIQPVARRSMKVVAQGGVTEAERSGFAPRPFVFPGQDGGLTSWPRHSERSGRARRRGGRGRRD